MSTSAMPEIAPHCELSHETRTRTALQKRMDKLTRQRCDAERRADAAERRIRLLEAEVTRSLSLIQKYREALRNRRTTNGR